MKEYFKKLGARLKALFTKTLTGAIALGTAVLSGLALSADQIVAAFPVFFSPDLIAQVKAWVPEAKQATLALSMSVMFALARLRSVWKSV